MSRSQHANTRSTLNSGSNTTKIGAIVAACTLALTLVGGPAFSPTAVAEPVSNDGLSAWYEAGRGPTVVGTPAETPSNLVPQIPDAHSMVTSVVSNFANKTSSSENIESVRDRNSQTKWYTGSGMAISEQEPIYAIYSLRTPATLTAYELVSANDFSERDPKAWKVYASNDPAAAADANHTSWVQIDSRSGESFPNRFQTRSFSINPGAAYSYYQLAVSEVKGIQSDGKLRMQLADWNLVGSIPGAQDAGIRLTAQAAVNVDPPAGSSAVRFVAKVASQGNARGVVVLHDGLSLAIGSDTQLSYLIRPEHAQSSAVPVNEVRVDVVVKDPDGIESTVTLDTDSEPVVAHRWNNVTADLSAHAGKTVTKILVRVDAKNAAAGQEFNGYIDNLVIGRAPVGPATNWSYYDAGNDPAAGQHRLAWTEQGFDNSQWKTGSGGFWALKSGSSMTNTISKTTEMKWALDTGKAVPAYFFRTEFDLSAQDIASNNGAYAFLVYDDTATVFVNGRRVAGWGDRMIDSNIDYQNIAGQGDPLRQVVSVPIGYLKEGTNVLAVAVHQCNDTSSDAYFYMPSFTLTPSYLSAPFSSDDFERKYPSDTRPVGPKGGDYQVEMLSDFNNLLANHPEIIAPNVELSNSATPTAMNDTQVIKINNNAASAQQQRALIDGAGSSHKTMADGFGPVLGPLYETAMSEGRLPRVDKLVSGRIERFIGDHEPAKAAFGYKRPYVRMGFQQDGGRMVMVDSKGAYDGLRGNGSFPSGHTNHGYSQGTTLATLVPQVADSMMLRTSEYGYNRMVLSFHYPLDVLGSTMIGQHVAQQRWSDPQFRELLYLAQAEVQTVLSEDCGTDTIDECLALAGVEDPRLPETERQVYTDRLTYGLPAIRSTDDKFVVPAGTGDLLMTKYPSLTSAQRNLVVAATALPSGQPLDKSNEGVPSWQRVNLAEAFAADVEVREDGVLLVNGKEITEDGETPEPTVSTPYESVNMWIGTYYDRSQNKGNDAYGNTWPGATLPFGMVQFTPTTYKTDGSEERGGYEYTADKLRGFGMTRLSGTGCMGNNGAFETPLLTYTGQVGANGILPVSPGSDIRNYYMPFDHSGEVGNPGYYKVDLKDGVAAELTATTRTTVGRFKFPTGMDSATLIFNASGSNNKDSGDVTELTIDPATRTISGSTVSKTVCGEGKSKLYFSAEFDKDFENFGTWSGGTLTSGATTVTGSGKDQAGAYFSFNRGDTVGVKTGISYVSVENAKLNRETETNDKDFDTVWADAKATWEEALERVDTEGGDDALRTIFYTALYRSLIHPNVYSDVNGQYRGYGIKTGVTGEVKQLKTGQDAEYVTYASWDTYRSQAQLIALLFPERASDINQSITNMAQQTGTWYNWPHLGSAQNKMQGDGLQIILSSMDAFGATDYDRVGALESMVKTQGLGGTFNSTRKAALSFAGVGWIEDRQSEGTSTTLELAVADFSIGQLAQRLGDVSATKNFMARSMNWRNLLSQDSAYPDRLVPRDRKGHWASFDLRNRSYSSGKPDSAAQNGQFDQSTGLQYQWMVPHDMGGLIEALGGKDVAKAKLDSLLTQLDHSGVTSDYAYMSNQPNMHLPWVYNWLGAPNKAAEIVDRAFDQMYFEDAIVNGKPGLPGNDDLGSFGAWLVWAGIGLYPSIFGRAELAVSAPKFDEVTITPEGANRAIEITANGASAKRTIAGMKVNGTADSKSWLSEDFVRSGGTLEFTLTDGQATTWGTAPADLPPSFPANFNGFNSVGTTVDGTPSGGALEFSNNTLSRNLLAAAGTGPGKTLVWDGIEFPWAPAEPLSADHWIPWGQIIDMGGVHAKRISFLGLATNGPSQGTAIVNYSDGTKLEVPIYLTDWTPSGSPGGENTAVVKMPYRNNSSGDPSTVSNQVQIFATAPAALDPVKAIDSVTLPNDVKAGIMHLFAIGLDKVDPPTTIEVTPADPTMSDQGLITIPTMEGVKYEVAVGGTVVTPVDGKVQLTAGQSAAVTASPLEGYSFPVGTVSSWNFKYDPEVVVIDVVPAAPTMSADGVVTVPSVQGLAYEVYVDGVATTPVDSKVSLMPGQEAVVTATALDGYRIPADSDSEWTLKFIKAVTPEVPTMSEDGAVTIPRSEGVNYRVRVNGRIVIVVGSTLQLRDGQVAEVEAIPRAGFKIADGAESTWDFKFEAPVPPTELVVERISGPTRYATNLEVNKATMKAGKPVFIATGASYPDALSVSPAVKALDGSLVLTAKTRMDQATLNLLASNSPSAIYVVGGANAVADSVLMQVEEATGKAPERIAGTSRYETSEKIFTKFFANRDINGAFVATGRAFPDALSASAAGGALEMPVILVDGKTSTALNLADVLAAKTRNLQIIGGINAVNSILEANLMTQFDVGRISGSNRFATNMAVNDYVTGNVGDTALEGIWIATGMNFPDALSASVPAGEQTQRLVLSNGKCIPSPVVSEWIRGEGSEVTKVTLVGGTGALSDAVYRLTECN